MHHRASRAALSAAHRAHAPHRLAPRLRGDHLPRSAQDLRSRNVRGRRHPRSRQVRRSGLRGSRRRARHRQRIRGRGGRPRCGGRQVHRRVEPTAELRDAARLQRGSRKLLRVASRHGWNLLATTGSDDERHRELVPARQVRGDRRKVPRVRGSDDGDDAALGSPGGFRQAQPSVGRRAVQHQRPRRRNRLGPAMECQAGPFEGRLGHRSRRRVCRNGLDAVARRQRIAPDRLREAGTTRMLSAFGTAASCRRMRNGITRRPAAWSSVRIRGAACRPTTP